jgi:hypothetical protein
VWRWYSRIAGGTDEVIRHAVAKEAGNDITVWSPAFNGKETYKMSSWNRTRRTFVVLLYSDGANGKTWAKVSIPSTVRKGRYFNNEASQKNFRGEGLRNGSKYIVRVETKDICRRTGRDLGVFQKEYGPFLVENGTLVVTIENFNKFTTVEFLPTNKPLKATDAE